MDDNVTKKDIFRNKDLRQDLEIDMFLKEYNKNHNSDFRVFQKRDKPDYLIKDSSGTILGVELSSVYMNDRTVVDEHLREDPTDIPYDSDTHQNIRNNYFRRIVDKIKDKANKIDTGQYDISYLIILSLYLNDYYTIHIDNSEWQLFIEMNNHIFSNSKEFKEVFLIK